MRRFRKVRHVPLPLLAVIMAAILFAELARCEREGAKETAAEAAIAALRKLRREIMVTFFIIVSSFPGAGGP